MAGDISAPIVAADSSTPMQKCCRRSSIFKARPMMILTPFRRERTFRSPTGSGGWSAPTNCRRSSATRRGSNPVGHATRGIASASGHDQPIQASPQQVRCAAHSGRSNVRTSGLSRVPVVLRPGTEGQSLASSRQSSGTRDCAFGDREPHRSSFRQFSSQLELAELRQRYGPELSLKRLQGRLRTSSSSPLT